MNTERMREMENYKNLERVVLALLEMDAPVTSTLAREHACPTTLMAYTCITG